MGPPGPIDIAALASTAPPGGGESGGLGLQLGERGRRGGLVEAGDGGGRVGLLRDLPGPETAVFGC